ncbi:MAG: hypothetical protein K9K80_02485 [Spirochaetia bacterium]|nr:hypothetical protein [Spirochaetia bacterium]
MVIFDSYAVIASGWNTSGSGDSKGIEIINLETGISYHYTSDDIPLPSDAVFALEVQQINNDSVRLWFGTFDGIAYCDVILN